MKRRKFLKTVGSAAGAAALGACSTPRGAKAAKRPKVKHPPTGTYGLASISPPDPNPPFKLSVRTPGWYPDGADLAAGPCQRLFQEEVIGIKKNGRRESFPVHFQDPDEASKKWVLGSKLKKPTEVPADEQNFTLFVRQVAVRVRQYNASLYRLRRLYFCYQYQKYPNDWPQPNPWGSKPDRDPFSPPGFTQRLDEAKADWESVTDNLNEFLETTGKGAFKFKLLAADMVAVNGYILSMRVVVAPRRREPGGSSSHVSISSHFSSSSA